MRYISTRGKAPTLSFDDVLLTGLARDGGLYLPESWPDFPDDLERLAELSYAELATRILTPFTAGCLTEYELAELTAKAYANFSHPAVAPLSQLEDNLWLMELYQSPTLAFKDYALQMVGLLFDHVLAKRGERITIVAATSGDTGSAAIDACRDRENIDIFILHPEGRVSDVQRRQMTSVMANNVFNIALDGSFDDCQDLVKALFNDTSFRDDVSLSAVNSINWARIMAQIVYYAYASLRLGSKDRPVNFAVPTGNFGNIFAGYAAKKCGFPIGKLVTGANRNDILYRFFNDNAMTLRPVEPSLSPSMDIQVSSNFERYLFELLGRDGAKTAEMMTSFRAEGAFSLPTDLFKEAQEDFAAVRASDDETLAQITNIQTRCGKTIDPHTAIGVLAGYKARDISNGPTVCLGTAHPAKFPDAVEKATGERPALPPHLADLFDRPEKSHSLPNDLARLQDFVRDNRRKS